MPLSRNFWKTTSVSRRTNLLVQKPEATCIIEGSDKKPLMVLFLPKGLKVHGSGASSFHSLTKGLLFTTSEGLTDAAINDQGICIRVVLEGQISYWQISPAGWALRLLWKVGRMLLGLPKQEFRG